MKCAKCGAELKVGCIFCSVCGQEAQIVSEDSLLEEELLRQLLMEEEDLRESLTQVKKPEHKSKAPADGKSKGAVEHKGKSSVEHKSKKSSKVWVLVLTLFLVVVLLALAATLFFVFRERNNNSFEYQVQKAESCVAERNYTKALEYYQRALELENKSVDVRMKMTALYERMEEPRKAVQLLHEVIELDKGNVEAYQKLINYYRDQSDYDSILKLKETATKDTILALFETFQVETPAFSLEPGTYGDDLEVALTAQEGCEIYYSLNGADPITNGSIYTEPFKLEEQGKLSLRVVACNQYGLYSEVLDGEFEVKYEKPKKPKANPDSGSFFMPSTIELSGEEGGKIYYTWDNTDPTANSSEYTGPIEVPEGNNILSAILIDKHGMVSDVMKCNYKYLP